MFMEVFLQICDVMTGKLDSASSGHNTHTHICTCTCNYPAKTGYVTPIQHVSQLKATRLQSHCNFCCGDTNLIFAAEWPLSGVGIILR